MPTANALSKLFLGSRHLFEYAAVRVLLIVIDAVPLRIAIGLANGCADLAFVLAAGRRRIARENVMRVGVADSIQSADRIVRAAFRNFAVMVVESLKSDRMFRDGQWERHVRFDIPAELEEVLKDTRCGLILATGHLGNWEIAGQMVSTWKPVAGVARPMTNPWVERLMQARRPRQEFHLIPKQSADITRFLAALKRGQVLALMIDQHAGPRGMVVDFMGQPASTQTAVALLHLVTGAPLCVGYCRRIGTMQFEMKAIGPLHFKPTGDRDRDVQAILARLNDELASAIRQTPEQYMWGHRRWRREDVERARLSTDAGKVRV